MDFFSTTPGAAMIAASILGGRRVTGQESLTGLVESTEVRRSDGVQTPGVGE